MDFVLKSIEFTSEEVTYNNEYAESKNMIFEEIVRLAVLEKIEDEEDLRIAKEAYEEFLKDPATYTIDEVIKELEL